jgi:hypothetical protein
VQSPQVQTSLYILEKQSFLLHVWQSEAGWVRLNMYSSKVGCDANFRFHSKRGTCERKQFRLEQKKMSSETGAPLKTGKRELKTFCLEQKKMSSETGAPLICVFVFKTGKM